MNEAELVKPEAAPEKLALAQQAFEKFHARCFWFMRPDAILVAEDVPYICERLRADGGREGFRENMPLGDFETVILRLLAVNRSPESYVAGATVFLRREDSYRQSQDIDVFHDSAPSLQRAAAQDTEMLQQNGYNVNWTERQEMFQQAPQPPSSRPN